MVCVLILDELYYRTVLELSHEQLSLVILGELECNLDDSATVLVFCQLYHVTMNLINNYSFVYGLAVLQQLLDDIVREDVDDKLLQVRKAFAKYQLAEGLVRL